MPNEKPRLGRDVYVALAAVGWADGQLDALGSQVDALKVPERPRAIVDGIAQDVANMSDDRPDRYDLPLLRRIMGERLLAAAQARAARSE